MNRITAKQVLPFAILSVVAILACFIKPVVDFVDTGKYNPADTAWIIVATALVFLMTPGLAFFYGGMVHRKNVLSTMIKSMVAAGIVSVLWIVVGCVSSEDEEIGLDASQHDEKYMQGTLLIHNNGKLEEKLADEIK